MSIVTYHIGTTCAGEKMTSYELRRPDGSSLILMNYGANILGLNVPDREGIPGDVVLGLVPYSEYEKSHDCMGDTVGRFANRIRNGHLSLPQGDIQLPLNAGKHHLHGGFVGFGNRIWNAEIIEKETCDEVIFRRISPDGEEGYPGNLNVSVVYQWDDLHRLSIIYEAYTDKPTVCNMTNHSYFNLSAQKENTIDEHVVQLFSSRCLETDEENYPTGRIIQVDGPLDFQKPVLMKNAFEKCKDNSKTKSIGGYDHSYLLDNQGEFKKAASVYHPSSGRYMEVFSNQPSMQFFTSNGSSFKYGKNGLHYSNHCGLCFEMQNCPDSPNHPEFGTSSILLPGDLYRRKTVYAFSAK